MYIFPPLLSKHFSFGEQNTNLFCAYALGQERKWMVLNGYKPCNATFPWNLIQDNHSFALKSVFLSAFLISSVISAFRLRLDSVQIIVIFCSHFSHLSCIQKYNKDQLFSINYKFIHTYTYTHKYKCNSNPFCHFLIFQFNKSSKKYLNQLANTTEHAQAGPRHFDA